MKSLLGRLPEAQSLADLEPVAEQAGSTLSPQDWQHTPAMQPPSDDAAPADGLESMQLQRSQTLPMLPSSSFCWKQH